MTSVSTAVLRGVYGVDDLKRAGECLVRDDLVIVIYVVAVVVVVVGEGQGRDDGEAVI